MNLFQNLLAGLSPLSAINSQNTQPVNAQSAGLPVSPSTANVASPSFGDYIGSPSMMRLGLSMLAAGQRQTPQQRMQTILGGAADFNPTRDINEQRLAELRNAQAQSLMNEQRRKTEIEATLRNDPNIAASLGITGLSPEQAKLLDYDALQSIIKARASHDPVDAAYKSALIRKMQEGDARQWQVIGEDELGVKKFGYPPLPGETATSATSASGSPQGSQASIFDAVGDTTGDEALKRIRAANPALASEVEQIANGRQQLPPRLLGTKRGDTLTALVSQVSGEQYDPNAFSSRKTMETEMSRGTKGSLGGQRNFGNTAIKHAGELFALIPELGNVSGVGAPYRNAGANEWRKFNGDTEARRKWDATAGNLAGEIASFYGNDTQAERDKIKSLFDPNRSPEELKAAIQEQVRDMYAKTSNLENQWTETMGPLQSKKRKIVFDDTKAVANAILGRENGGGVFGVSDGQQGDASILSQFPDARPLSDGTYGVMRNGKMHRIVPKGGN